ncbi:MAG: glycosyltransferase family 2 protein [Gemmatimonadaceae bacterium]|nr:glycosyltransferase family 2 protein [Gemmatimonadaceae bacterium]
MSHVSRRVSVIIPVRDRATMLPDAIESLLRQTRAPDEIIVVDDASIDDSRRVALSYGERVIVLDADGSGPAAARNVGIAVATGAFIGFLDSDDLWPPSALATQLALLDAHPDAAIAWSKGMWRLLDGGTPLSDKGDGAVERMVGVNSMLFRRTAFETLGGFDASLRFGEDHDLVRRSRAAGLSIVEGEDVVAIYRRHVGNLTADHAAARKGLLATAIAALRSRAHP